MNRDEKLKKLAGDKAAKEMVIITNGEPFIAALQEKIGQLKESLAKPLEIDNLDDAIKQLAEIGALHSKIEELSKSITDLKIPEVPDNIELKGLAELTKQLESLNNVSKSIEQLNETFISVRKALSDDIFSRYDYANSGQGPAGQYIGYLSQTGTWFIQKIGTTQNGDRTSTYTAGSSDYPKSWRAKENLEYLPRDKVSIT